MPSTKSGTERGMTMHRYRVKWTDNKGVTHYGIYIDRDASFNKKYYQNIPDGYAVVDDAILPVARAVLETSLVDIPFGDYDNDEYDKHVGAEEQKAREISDALPAKTVAVGAMFDVGVADGSASYVVTKVNKKTCNVEWRGYCLDRYYDHWWGAGRKSVPHAEVRRYLPGRLFASVGRMKLHTKKQEV